MNADQLAVQAIKNSQDIAALWEHSKSAHKRIDENDRITEGIHKLAANVEALALQVKILTDQMDKNVARIEAGQKLQGKRIGAIEQIMASFTDIKESVTENTGKIESLEKEPANKWKTLVSQVIGIVVAAIVGGVIAKLIR